MRMRSLRAAISREVNALLGDDSKRRGLGERAAAYGVAQLWPSVARAYLESFERACTDHRQQDRVRHRAETRAARVDKFRSDRGLPSLRAGPFFVPSTRGLRAHPS